MEEAAQLLGAEPEDVAIVLRIAWSLAQRSCLRSSSRLSSVSAGNEDRSASRLRAEIGEARDPW